jgi:hypothetical protein
MNIIKTTLLAALLLAPVATQPQSPCGKMMKKSPTACTTTRQLVKIAVGAAAVYGLAKWQYPTRDAQKDFEKGLFKIAVGVLFADLAKDFIKSIYNNVYDSVEAAVYNSTHNEAAE